MTAPRSTCSWRGLGARVLGAGAPRREVPRPRGGVRVGTAATRRARGDLRRDLVRGGAHRCRTRGPPDGERDDRGAPARRRLEVPLGGDLDEADGRAARRAPGEGLGGGANGGGGGAQGGGLPGRA